MSVDAVQQKSKVPLSVASSVAELLLRDLRDGCERIEIAGSIRRRRENVGDIEIVAIPKFAFDLLGGRGYSELDGAIDRLMDISLIGIWLAPTKTGDRYKQFKLFYKGLDLCKLDLFIVSQETWGCQFAIRTGPASFSHRLVTPRRHGGLCPAHLRFKDGRLWHNEVALETPEEKDVFDFLGLPWCEPWQRT